LGFKGRLIGARKAEPVKDARPERCHPERSEESTWMVLLKSKWILRFAQDDKNGIRLE
jgi:hypothetical protein